MIDRCPDYLHDENIPVEPLEGDYDDLEDWEYKDEFESKAKEMEDSQSDAPHKEKIQPTTSKLVPLTPDQTQANNLLTGKPSPIQSLMDYYDTPFLPKNIVGMIVGIGGIGKTYFMYQLAYALTSGTNFGPLRPPRKLKVLMIIAEDPKDEIQRRLYKLTNGERLPDGLHIYPGVGKVGPLMKYENGNPQPTDFYHFLDQSIANYKDLDLLILDPKSRFYGLNENDNDQATQWISMLERLKEKHMITILFTHHVPKSKSGDPIDQAMSRGASALVDGVRWVGGIKQMNSEKAKDNEISAKEHIEFDVPKTNYTRKLPNSLAFKRLENGLFEFQNLSANRLQAISELLCEVLRDETAEYSKDQLLRLPEKENPVFAKLKNRHENISKNKDLRVAIEFAIKNGMIEESSEKVGKTSKKILKVK